MKKSWTREELYELVWSTPVSTLAAELGMSDRGIGKMCERLNVPTPGRGYWAKRAAGRKVPKAPPLPKIKQAAANVPKPKPMNKRGSSVPSSAASQDFRRNEHRESIPTPETRRLGKPDPTPTFNVAEKHNVADTSRRSSEYGNETKSGQPNFANVTFDDMISHEALLELHPWLSAQIINRWRRKRLIRSFRGKKALIYSKTELNCALESEMRIDDPPEPRQRPSWTPSERDKAISAVVTEEQSLRLISKGGVLSAGQVEQINRMRQEVDLGPITSEPRSPPSRTKRSRTNTPARSPRGKKAKSVD